MGFAWRRWLLIATAAWAIAGLPAPAVAQEAPNNFDIHRFWAAAQRGDAAAMRNVGIIYAFGYGVPMNKKEAFKWLSAAARKGDAKAQYHLAWLYRTGQGVALDYDEATRWETQSAEAGFLPAMVSLAKVQLQSNNYFEAERWFRRAYAKGDIEAKQQLVVLYSTGAMCDCDYGGLDYARGMAWVSRLAEGGDLSAMWAMGLVNEHRERYRDAYVWYMLAAAMGHQESEQRVLLVNDHLSPEEQAAAEAEVKRRWARISR